MATIVGQAIVTNGSARVVAALDSTALPILVGLLVTNKVYRIVEFKAGDNFTNVGGTNVTGNIFKATGTTPTTWTNGSILQEIVNSLADWSSLVLSKDIFYVPPKRNIPGYEQGQGYWIIAFTDGSTSGSGFDEITLQVAFGKPTGSVFYEIHTDFTTLGFPILKYGDTETADLINRIALLAENLISGGTVTVSGGAQAVQVKTISGGEVGLDVVTVTFDTPMPSTAPTKFAQPVCIKVADGDDNNPCVGISSITTSGFKIHLQSGAIAGQKYSCSYVPTL